MWPGFRIPAAQKLCRKQREKVVAANVERFSFKAVGLANREVFLCLLPFFCLYAGALHSTTHRSDVLLQARENDFIYPKRKAKKQTHPQ